MELEGEGATDGFTEWFTEPTDVSHCLTCLSGDLVAPCGVTGPASSRITTCLVVLLIHARLLP